MFSSNNADGEELVLVYDAPDQETAELICAVLKSSGIPAVVQNHYAAPAAGMLTHLGLSYSKGVLVPASNEEASLALLADQELTEEELTAEVDADTMTLEDAEKHVK